MPTFKNFDAEMRGKARLVRDERDGYYEVYVRNHFWQCWKLLVDSNGKPIRFKSFKEFGEITKIESFGDIIIEYDRFQGM